MNGPARVPGSRGLGWRVRVAVLGFLARIAYGLVRFWIRPVFGPDLEPISTALAAGEHVVFVFWHGELAMMQAAHDRYVKDRGICIQVSLHSDGEIITRAVRHHGIRTARGSASRGAVRALRAMLAAYDDGWDLAIAGDGPRGPRHELKRAPLQLAMATGARIFPVAAAAERAWSFRSWDRFTVPKPWSHVHYVIGRPTQIDRQAAEGSVEQARRGLEDELQRIGREADRRARAVRGLATMVVP